MSEPNWATALLADLDNIEAHVTAEATLKRFTLEDLRDGSDDFEEVAAIFEDWADRSVRDVLDDKIDGTTWSDGRTVDLGSSMKSPVWRRLESIGSQVRRELAA